MYASCNDFQIRNLDGEHQIHKITTLETTNGYKKNDYEITQG